MFEESKNCVKTEKFLLVFLFQMVINRVHYIFSIVLASVELLRSLNIINETVIETESLPTVLIADFCSSIMQFHSKD